MLMGASVHLASQQEIPTVASLPRNDISFLLCVLSFLLTKADNHNDYLTAQPKRPWLSLWESWHALGRD